RVRRYRAPVMSTTHDLLSSPWSAPPHAKPLQARDSVPGRLLTENQPTARNNRMSSDEETADYGDQTTRQRGRHDLPAQRWTLASAGDATRRHAQGDLRADAGGGIA